MSGSSPSRVLLLALDLDGTLLSSQHTLSDRTKETLRRLSRKGVCVSIATGRSYNAVRDVVAELQCATDPMPVVCYNGAVGLTVPLTSCTASPNSQSTAILPSTVFQACMPETSVRTLLALAGELGLVAQYYDPVNGNVQAVPKTEGHRALMSRYAGLTVRCARSAAIM